MLAPSQKMVLLNITPSPNVVRLFSTGQIPSKPCSSEEVIPAVFNGLPVVKTWAALKLKSTAFKLGNVIKHNQSRLCLVPNGYVLLCSSVNCRSLASENNLCKNHNKGVESYRFCREEGCGKQACYGYEYKKGFFLQRS
jgi:hypothetical protein